MLKSSPFLALLQTILTILLILAFYLATFVFQLNIYESESVGNN